MSAACTASPLPSLSLPGQVPAVPSTVRRGAWQLAAGQATTLKASAATVLRIRQGRVWITCDATSLRGSEDLVLAPGESMRLASGQRMVMESWDGYGATYTWEPASTLAD
jgi:hypothetical protein